jgi:hypothetical protein
MEHCGLDTTTAFSAQQRQASTSAYVLSCVHQAGTHAVPECAGVGARAVLRVRWG